MHWTQHVLVYLLCFLAMFVGGATAEALRMPFWSGLVAVLVVAGAVRLLWNVRQSDKK